MKSLFLILSFFAFSKAAFCEWKSVVTDISHDCVVVSSATEEAPIDFFKSECKSFAGYELSIEGGDIRYHPELSFRGETIDLNNPMSFHDLGSDEITWLYKSQINNEGSGSIEWKGLVYSLSETTEDEDDVIVFHSVYLNGEKSCALSTSKTKEEAILLVQSFNGQCH
jgi:hypothetical protein